MRSLELGSIKDNLGYCIRITITIARASASNPQSSDIDM